MDEPVRKHIEAQTVAYLDLTGPYSEIGPLHHRLYQWAHEAGVEPAGHAFTIFLVSPDEETWQAGRFEVCLPVPADTKPGGGVRIKSVPAADVLSVVVAGPYSDVPAHYAELLAWISWENVSIAGPPREIYLVHPGPRGTADPAKLRTEIQFPIADE